MAKSIRIASDADYLKAWDEFRENFRRSTPIDAYETPIEKAKRIKQLEANPETWFKYYFPNYCTAEPADFHKKSTRRILKNKEWFEIRAWSRELAKTARTMMEDIFIALVEGDLNLLQVSNTHDNAERILLPYKSCFEANQRIINDYGKQQKHGDWSSDEFTIKNGSAFRAIGWGESPRGTRKENRRPNKINIDDIDTDVECRNEEIKKNKFKWIEQALYGTRSVSEPLRMVVNGNIIHENCVINKLKEKADYVGVVNIRDEHGKSTWATKNTEEMIDRVLSKISYESAQKEYFNNPMDGGETFKDLKDGKIPRLDSCQACIYADPATSNKDVSSGSPKAIVIVLKKDFDYYVARAALDTMSNAKFVDYLFEFYVWCISKGAENVKVYIENNSLQNPFYEQVLLPMIYARANETKVFLPITGDDRKKDDKYTRIEGTLEPINRLGHLIFNEAEKDEPNMKRLKAQFKNFTRKQKRMDGPDAVEGAVFKLRETGAVEVAGMFKSFKRVNSKRFGYEVDDTAHKNWVDAMNDGKVI